MTRYANRRCTHCRRFLGSGPPISDRPVDLSGEPRRNFIDDAVLETLETLRIPVSPPASDATFLRRVRLDLTGRLPKPKEVRDFLADRSPEKRDRLVDRLLGSEEFSDVWAFRFATLLQIRSRGGEPEVARTFHAWLRDQIDRGTSLVDIARVLLTAEGDSHEYGPANFYRMVNGARAQAEYVGRVFMGVRIGCANCHNHPLDRWTQDDYHGLAAVFARIDRGRHVRVLPRGAVMNPRTGEPAVPRLPGGRTLDPDGDPRRALADWLTADENPYFARAIVNRLWASMFGRGLVEPVDDLRATNPATHPGLLDSLAADFNAHGDDLRHTLRRIATSATYARGGAIPENRVDDRFYSHALARPLAAEVLADALADVTGVSDRYGDLPAGTRAVALPDANIPAESLDILGRCSREAPCAGSGLAGVGLAETLHRLNGPLINRKLADPEGRLARLRAQGCTEWAIVVEFYLLAPSARTPTDPELRLLAPNGSVRRNPVRAGDDRGRPHLEPVELPGIPDEPLSRTEEGPMMTFHQPLRRCDGIVRRDVLRLGCLTALGLTAGTWSRLRAGSPRRAGAKSCILIWLDGGPSHLETFDPKPEAPSEVRGPFGSIETALPGVRVSEVMPGIARQLDRMAVLRSVTSPLGEHNLGSHYLLTGYQPSPALKYPGMGSVVARLRGGSGLLPPYVAVPYANAAAGPGYLPAECSPFVVGGDPSKPDFHVRDLDCYPGLDGLRIERRRAYLKALDRFSRMVESGEGAEDPEFEQAYRLTTSPRARAAFDLAEEPDKLRDRYGRRTLGQSLMLARRLVERGVPFVTVNDRGWDTHQDLVTRLRDGYTGAKVGVGLVPTLDQGLSALLDDLGERGLLTETLVVVMGEFGRTPKLNTAGGRDHWPRVFSVALAGGGVRGGQVVGVSDTTGEGPAERPMTPADLACTLYTLLGIDLAHTLRTADGRPVRVNQGGSVISEVLS